MIGCFSKGVAASDLKVLSDSPGRPRDEICAPARIDDEDLHWMLSSITGSPAMSGDMSFLTCAPSAPVDSTEGFISATSGMRWQRKKAATF